MRQILSNHDLKTLIQGIAGVAASGLLVGAAMHPNLDAHAVEGPQMQAPGGGERGTGAAGDLGLAAYPGQPPEYVVGTDWTRPQPVQYADAGGDTDVVVLAADDDPQPAPVPTRAAWRDEPREPTAYPSMRGNVDYEANLPPPPPPPGDADLGLGEGDQG
jgi:hypothetical protein